MKRGIIFILFIFFAQSLFSQISDCSACDSKIYTENEISHLTVLELKLLRNEIFARHQYLFNDSDLIDYFSEKYSWYKPNYESNTNFKLNNVEEKNIKLFLMYEKEKEALQKTIITTLQELKQAFTQQDTIKINATIKQVVTTNQTEYYDAITNEINNILSCIPLDKIHWFNEKGLFKITTDDGYLVNEISININGNQIVLQYADIGYSKLLDDETAFSYGSAYDSTNEYQSWYTFEIIDNKLVLLNHQAAG